MGWNIFGRRKRAETRARAQARARMPPVMAPGENTDPPPRGHAGGGAGISDGQMDALTVMAAIESAKQELARREAGMRRQAEARARAGRADPCEDPTDAVARKKQLIQAAMAVHKFKQSALNELDPKDRDRLRVMAESALGVGEDPKKKR